MSETPVLEGEILWRPDARARERANLTKYMQWLRDNRGRDFAEYGKLWSWSTESLEDFWRSIWDYFEVQADGEPKQVLASRDMPGAQWFPGVSLNFAEHILRNRAGRRTAALFKCEDGPLEEIAWDDLAAQVASVAAWLREMGVESGDRVVGFLPNIPQTVVVFLAAASLGAVWSCSSPDFAGRSVIDRFGQIEPKVLFAVDAYVYGGKVYDTTGTVEKIRAGLPTLRQVVQVSYADRPGGAADIAGAVPFADLLERNAPLEFNRVPFDHPLWIVYSSGTTGLPKGLVHGHGGILLEMYKFLSFQVDLHPGDVFFWYSTTGWVMWNIVLSSLLTGAVPVLYDGNPGYPDLGALWRMAEQAGLNFFGTSAAFIGACMKQGIRPGAENDLSKLRAMGSTGSPLSPEGFRWIYDEVSPNIVLGSTSGGTDICSGFMGACPLLPVRAGELQCRCLGVKAQAWDDDGNELIDQVGELVITEPMPSMPIYLWNDGDGSRYQDSYFDRYPGIWRHGDWVKFTAEGGAMVLGRSDSTLNRQGVRMGSSDFYRVVEDLDEVEDSLIIGYLAAEGQYHMPMFVVLRQGIALDEGLKKKIKTSLSQALSPRHVPDEVYAIPQVPKTINGKKLEVPIIKIMQGVPAKKAVNADSMANPESLEFFVRLAAQ